MYFWFDLYEKRSDDRIWRSRCIVYSSDKKDAEKRAREPIHGKRDLVACIFRKKAENFDSKVFKPAKKETKIHEGIPSTNELRELGIAFTEMQKMPYEYNGFEPVEEIENEPFRSEPKYESIKCEYCGESIPKNGAAQFSHLRKHVKQLVDQGMISDLEAKQIRKVKLNPKMKKRFQNAFRSL